MSRPDINTSTPLRDNTTPGGNTLGSKDGWLFPQGAVEETSSCTFTVEAGKAWKLSAFVVGGFNDGDQWEFNLHSIIRPSKATLRPVSDCSGCGPVYGYKEVPTADQYSIPVVINGKHVQLTETNNVMIVTIPGTYRLIRNQDKQQGGEVVVHALLVDWDSTRNMIAWGGL